MQDAPMLMIHLTSLPDAKLARMARDLERDLSRLGIGAQPIPAEPAPGERGDSVTIGTLALATITSGAVSAMIECLKIYLSRERSLTFKVVRQDGSQVELTGKNIDTPEIRRAIQDFSSAK